MPERREIILYIPAGGHRATVGIPRGSAIVGQPQAEVDEVEIHFQAGGLDHHRRESLADRALIASGRLLEGVEGESSKLVPREALLVVGVFVFGERRIVLTGKHSVRALADWLGFTSSAAPSCGREARHRSASKRSRARDARSPTPPGWTRHCSGPCLIGAASSPRVRSGSTQTAGEPPRLAMRSSGPSKGSPEAVRGAAAGRTALGRRGR